MPNRKPTEDQITTLSSLLGEGFGQFVRKLADLADKGEALKQAGEFQVGPGGRGVFGVSIRVGRGAEGEAVQVERFGNVRQDASTGQPVVSEQIEPLVDLFEESDHLLIVAELPGVAAEQVLLELVEEKLRIQADAGRKKYRKEIVLPFAPNATGMTHSCHNGVLEVRLPR